MTRPDEPVARCEHAGGSYAVETASAVIVDVDGRHLASFGDPHRTVPMRSTLKPLRVLALLRSGTILEADEEAIALAAGSHTGSSAHLDALSRFAGRYGVDIGELRCSIRAPLDSTTPARTWSQLENECSGEHIGALILANALGVPASAYMEPEAAVHRHYGITLAEALSDTDVSRRLDGRDGCGMPSFTATLAELATAYARLASPEWFEGLGAVVSGAVCAEPLLYSGEHQFVHGLIRQSDGRVLGKGGAGGLYAAWWPDRHVGAAASASSGFHGAAAVALRCLAGRAGLPFPDDAPYYLDDGRLMSYEVLSE